MQYIQYANSVSFSVLLCCHASRAVFFNSFPVCEYFLLFHCFFFGGEGGGGGNLV